MMLPSCERIAPVNVLRTVWDAAARLWTYCTPERIAYRLGCCCQAVNVLHPRTYCVPSGMILQGARAYIRRAARQAGEREPSSVWRLVSSLIIEGGKWSANKIFVNISKLQKNVGCPANKISPTGGQKSGQKSGQKGENFLCFFEKKRTGTLTGTGTKKAKRLHSHLASSLHSQAIAIDRLGQK